MITPKLTNLTLSILMHHQAARAEKLFALLSAERPTGCGELDDRSEPWKSSNW